jgi:tRNA/rRNA methyltransferase
VKAIPTEAERILWKQLINDRRFAGRGFKRQMPIGLHVNDFASFPLKCVIDLVPEAETEAAIRAREQKRAWLEERGYRVIAVTAADVERDVAEVLEKLAAVVPGTA